MSVSIRMTKEEEQLAKDYAKLSGISTSEAFRRALFREIEDVYDIAVGEQAYRDYLKNPKDVIPYEEAMKMLGLTADV